MERFLLTQSAKHGGHGDLLGVRFVVWVVPSWQSFFVSSWHAFRYSYSSASTNEPRTADSAGQIAAASAATSIVGINPSVTDTGNS
jgi:hypothetical protein